MATFSPLDEAEEKKQRNSELSLVGFGKKYPYFGACGVVATVSHHQSEHREFSDSRVMGNLRKLQQLRLTREREVSVGRCRGQ